MSDKQDFSEIGDKIKDAVQDAVNSGDFGQLNRVINDSVSGALDEVRWQVNQAHDRVYNRTDKTVEYKSAKRNIASSYSTSQSPYRRQMEQKQRYTTAKQYQRPDGTVVYKDTVNLPRIFVKKGKVSSVLLSVFGGIGLGTFGLTALIMAIMWAATSDPAAGWTMAVFGIMAAGNGIVLKRGSGLRRRLNRAERYLKMAGEEMYIRISDLSEKTGWSEKKLGRDIRGMIESGMFPEGHMDEKNDIFVIDDETWDQYLEEKEEYEQQIAAKKRNELTGSGAGAGQSVDEAKNSDTTAGSNGSANGKTFGQNGTDGGASGQNGAAHSEEALTKEAQIEKDGQAYMERLRELNIQIPGEVISNKLYKLDYLLKRIFQTLREHPEQSDQMRRFMEYYLPTTVKLVESYAEFDSAGVEGENIRTAKEEIEKTMDTINEAFEKLLDDLYQDAAFEASADAKVLKTVLAQDGYMKSDFEKQEE